MSVNARMAVPPVWVPAARTAWGANRRPWKYSRYYAVRVKMSGNSAELEKITGDERR
jgi:hypothetical protein